MSTWMRPYLSLVDRMLPVTRLILAPLTGNSWADELFRKCVWFIMVKLTYTTLKISLLISLCSVALLQHKQAIAQGQQGMAWKERTRPWCSSPPSEFDSSAKPKFDSSHRMQPTRIASNKTIRPIYHSSTTACRETFEKRNGMRRREDLCHWLANPWVQSGRSGMQDHSWRLLLWEIVFPQKIRRRVFRFGDSDPSQLTAWTQAWLVLKCFSFIRLLTKQFSGMSAPGDEHRFQTNSCLDIYIITLTVLNLILANYQLKSS